jgi:hypothetical protein
MLPTSAEDSGLGLGKAFEEQQPLRNFTIDGAEQRALGNARGKSVHNVANGRSGWYTRRSFSDKKGIRNDSTMERV